jgi:type II secretory pathway pseudopilin PulG
MIARRSSYNGFTLIEVLVSGVVGVVIMAGILSFLNIYSTTVKDGTANSLIQQQTDIVSEQLSRNIMAAAQALPATETYSVAPGNARVSSSDLILYDNTERIVAAYKFESGLLMESHDTLAKGTPPGNVSYTNFKVGTGFDVHVSTSADSCNFSLAPGRRNVAINLVLRLQYINKWYSSSPRVDTVNCRN